jgi:hypothetical protein
MRRARPPRRTKASQRSTAHFHFQKAAEDRSGLRARQNQYFLPPRMAAKRTAIQRVVTAPTTEAELIPSGRTSTLRRIWERLPSPTRTSTRNPAHGVPRRKPPQCRDSEPDLKLARTLQRLFIPLPELSGGPVGATGSPGAEPIRTDAHETPKRRHPWLLTPDKASNSLLHLELPPTSGRRPALLCRTTLAPTELQTRTTTSS